MICTTVKMIGSGMEKYLTPDQVCDLIPGMTRGGLAQLRFTGKGPVYLKPTARKVVYRESDVIAWLEASERTSTAEAV
ncbi:helix-turn-helix transcriptional regulator [Microbacterium mitrae]|nr:helix-turn-helix domain-containing protein [Microbacterium mitrae]